MTVQDYNEFLQGQADKLKGYIAPREIMGTHQQIISEIPWPLIALIAREAKSAITSFVESELRRQISVRAAQTTNTTGILSIDLAGGVRDSDYNRPYSRSSLRTVRSSLYKLARVIKPYFLSVRTNVSDIKTIGMWHHREIFLFRQAPNATPFSRVPFQENSNGGLIDNWLVSLSYWLFAFVSGLHFRTSNHARDGVPSAFTPDLQAAALTDGGFDFFIQNTRNDSLLWSTTVSNTPVLMTLSQSLDTLLELPELRLGVLCANYLKNIEGLLPDVIDYNIDLKNESKDSVAHYVRGKMRLIAEFTSQELENLDNLAVRQIRCSTISSVL